MITKLSEGRSTLSKVKSVIDKCKGDKMCICDKYGVDPNYDLAKGLCRYFEIEDQYDEVKEYLKKYK